jgi:hypothetical protein
MALWQPETARLPWELHRSFTADRLTKVASIIRRTRDSAARGAKWALGDDLLVVGITAYKRAIKQLAVAAMNEYQDWLSTEIDEGHHLIKIGSVPLRHYRGIEDEPVPDKYQIGRPAEIEAKKLAFEGMEMVEGYFRFEVATTRKGFTESISFVLIDPYGQRQHPWIIPTFSESTRKKKGGVVLPAAEAGTAEAEANGTQDSKGG